MNTQQKIRDFTELRAWQEAHKLVIFVYQYSKKFPRDEMFALTSQIRRASVSVTSNIAEGFGRVYPKEKVQFYTRSHGSLAEVKSQLYLSRDLHYLSVDGFIILMNQANLAHIILQGLLKSSRSKVL